MDDRLATIDVDRKEGGVVPFSGLGGLGPHLTQCGQGRGLPPYQVASWSIQPFCYNRHGPKIGGCVPLRGGLGLHLTQCSLGRGLPPYQVASWSIQPFGHNTWTEKWGTLLCPPFLRGAKSSLPSEILIYPVVCPQQTWVENWEGCARLRGELGPHLQS